MKSRAPLFGVLIAVLLAVAFYFLLYSPRNDDLAAVQAETAQLETQQASLRNEIAQLREVEANQVQIRAALARLEEYIPSGTAQSTIVRQFQLAADAAGVEIVSLAFAPPTAAEDAPPTGTPGTVLGRLPVDMTVAGGFFQVVDFFRRIEVDVPRAVLMANSSTIEDEEAGFPALLTSWQGVLFAVLPTGSVTEYVPPGPDAQPDEELETEGAQDPFEDADGIEETDDSGEAGAEDGVDS